MGVKCINGSSMTCTPEQSRNFGGAVPPYILNFEETILNRVFGVTKLAVWEQNKNYHAYYNMGVIGRDTNLDRAWKEYLLQPAPLKSGRRSTPVRNGEVSEYVSAAPRSAHTDRVRVPLPGGYVTHHVSPSLRAIINTTNQMHVLYPGYIVRWLTLAGDILMSHTLGRGIGAQARVNEFYGVRIFGDLDASIAAELRTR